MNLFGTRAADDLANIRNLAFAICRLQDIDAEVSAIAGQIAELADRAFADLSPAEREGLATH